MCPKCAFYANMDADGFCGACLPEVLGWAWTTMTRLNREKYAALDRAQKAEYRIRELEDDLPLGEDPGLKGMIP
jgi:hypothetical protein